MDGGGAATAATRHAERCDPWRGWVAALSARGLVRREKTPTPDFAARFET